MKLQITHYSDFCYTCTFHFHFNVVALNCVPVLFNSDPTKKLSSNKPLKFMIGLKFGIWCNLPHSKNCWNFIYALLRYIHKNVKNDSHIYSMSMMAVLDTLLCLLISIQHHSFKLAPRKQLTQNNYCAIFCKNIFW